MVDFYFFNGSPGRINRVCDYKSHRHAAKMNFMIGQQRFIRNNAADLVFAGNIFIGENANDTRQGSGFADIEVADDAMGYR